MRRLLFRPTHGARRRTTNQRGQTLLIFAFLFISLIGVVGLATDGGVGYFYSVQIERAAAAAALAGVPYMPNSPATAQTRALAEAKSNGFVPGGNTSITFPAAQSGNFKVQITTKAPTYFMAALGFSSYNVTRIAEAGYRPPIALGQPSPQMGSTLPQLSGGAGNFYFLRFKGWNNDRSEGDAFTPNPSVETAHVYNGKTGSASNDVHQISTAAGNEAPQVASNDNAACPVGTVTAGANPLPCRGGYNYRVVVPATITTADIEIDVYNMAFAPEMGTNNNNCDNIKNPQAATATQCNQNGYDYAEQDSGESSCSDLVTCTVAKTGYLATEYSLFNVPDVFLRSNDNLLTQTKVLPIDATNWDCNAGGTGGGGCPGTANPTYMDVNTGNRVCQTYSATSTTIAAASNNAQLPTGTINVASTAGFPAGNDSLGVCTPGGWDQLTCTGKTATTFTGCSGGTHKLATGLAIQVAAANGAAPTNMSIYHNWADVVNYSGAADVDTSGNQLVTHTYTGNNGCSAFPCSVNSGSGNGLGVGTYRLRADALAYNGTIGTTQTGSKGYAVRAIHKGTGALCTECTVAAWQDLCVYSPVGSAGATTLLNAIPLFELTKDYAGTTINVDVFDVGDGGGGTVDLGLIDPSTNAIFAESPSNSTVPITQQGINESGSPFVQHVPGQAPAPDTFGSPPESPYASNLAEYRAADPNYQDPLGATGVRFQGTWVRLAIPVPSTYASVVPAYPNDYWKLQYALTNITMNDTFTLSVSATGGPVRLVSG